MSDELHFEFTLKEGDPMIEQLEKARKQLVAMGYEPKDLGEVISIVVNLVGEYLVKERRAEEITNTEYANAILFQMFPQLFPQTNN